MTTLTKPRAGSTRGPMMPSADRAEQAKKIITTTKRKVTMLMGDETANRSTRAQRAQRIKAQAFDRLAALGW